MKMICTFLLPFVFYSCATSHFHAETKVNLSQPVRSVFTLYIEEPLDLHVFDSSFFAETVNGRFNDLRTLPVRAQMEKTLKRNLSHPSTRVVASSELFGVNENFRYGEFRRRLDSAGVDAILLVNEEAYWETQSYSRVGYRRHVDTQPNSAFHCYLIDASTGKILWLGRCSVQGVFAGYENLNNLLARKVTRMLKDNGYLAKK